MVIEAEKAVARSKKAELEAKRKIEKKQAKNGRIRSQISS